MEADSVLLLVLNELFLYPRQDRVKGVFPPQRRREGLILGLQLK